MEDFHASLLFYSEYKTRFLLLQNIVDTIILLSQAYEYGGPFNALPLQTLQSEVQVRVAFLRL